MSCMRDASLHSSASYCHVHGTRLSWAAVQVYKATRGGVTTVAAKIMSSTVSDGSASTARTQVSVCLA